MRFFKIFLICFFSLIGAVGVIVGIMYLVGALNEKVVEPEQIMFDQTEYNIDSDFMITITSPTEGVTKKEVTLSLLNMQSKDSATGFMTDGVIIVPEKVQLDTPFLVQVYSEYDSELGKEWVVGGHSVLTAKSESYFPPQITVNINVDVKVDSITVKTYTNTTEKEEASSFAYGETFLAEAVFSPERSKYKFSDENQVKKVYFDISTNKDGVIRENEDVKTAMLAENQYHIMGFDVLDIYRDVKIYAYCFENAILENKYIAECAGDINSIIRELKLRSDGIKKTITLDFTNRSVSSFSIANDSANGDKYLKFNEINNIYANFKDSTKLTFGIKIDDKTNDQSLQNKVKDVGVAAYINTGTNYRLATAEEVKFVNYATGEESTSYRTVDGVRYYFPTMVASNVDKSYWSVVPLKENTSLQFACYMFENGDTISIEKNILNTGDLNSSGNPFQVWKTDVVKTTSYSWTDISDINLIVIDNPADSKIIGEEFDISSRFVMTTKGTYQTVKYLAYIDGEPAASSSSELLKILPDCQVTTKYSAGLGLTANKIYELKSPIIKPVLNGSFNVIAVIVKTDYLGRIMTESNGDYIIYSENSVSDIEKIKVNVSKTLKNLSAYIEVSDASALKNELDKDILDEDGTTILHKGSFDENNFLTKLAFASSTGTEEIFTIVFVVSAGNFEELKKEIPIFINSYNNGKLNFDCYNGEETSDLLIIPKNNMQMIDTSVLTEEDEDVKTTGSGYSYEFRFSVYANTCEVDTELKILYKYYQTSITAPVEKAINQVSFVGDLESLTFTTESDWVSIEMYDGKTDKIEFEYNLTEEEDETTWLTKEVNLTKAGTITPTSNVVYATTSDDNYVQYKLGNDIVTEDVLDKENGYIYRIKTYDKYGNEIANDPSTYVLISDDTGVEVRSTNVSSKKLIPVTDHLYFTTNYSGRLLSVAYNQGTIEDGKWITSDLTADNNTTNLQTPGFTLLENFDSNNVINISRYGVVKTDSENGAIQITGENGLLSVRYQLEETTYELCRILEYSFITYLSNYENVLSYDEDSGQLIVLKHINSDITLKIAATCELGFSYIINLTIKPNISITFERYSPQGEMSDVATDGYFSVYSDNYVTFNVKVTTYLRESFNLYTNSFQFTNNLSNINISTLSTSDSPTSNDNASEWTYVVKIIVEYSDSSLGKQEIELSTASALEKTVFDFSTKLKIVVYPNIQFNTEYEDSASLTTRHFSFDKLNSYKNIDLSLKKIISNDSDLTFTNTNGLTLKFAPVLINRVEYAGVYFEGSTEPLARNIFALGDNNQICAIDTLYGTYRVDLYLYYGGEYVGKVEVTITSVITENIGSESYDDYFTTYNGVKTLVFKSGEQYNLTFLKNLFRNVNEFTISENKELLAYDISTQVYTVGTINSYVFSKDKEANITLTLTQKQTVNDQVITVAVIEYPLLFSPLSIGYVTYQGGADTINLDAVQNDFARLLRNKDYLFGYNIYDAYGSGGSVSILKTETQQYGLSQEILDLIKNKALSCEIKDEDEVGDIIMSRQSVVTYDANNYELTVPSLSRDAYIYFIIKERSANIRTIGLYRIKLIANSAINVYYPYATSFYTQDNLSAEYKYNTDGSTILIDFNEIIDSYFPNAGHKRISLEQLNEHGEYVETANYQVKYSIAQVIHNNKIITDTETLHEIYGVGINGGYGASVLYISKGSLDKNNRIFEIIVNCEVSLQGIEMGTVEYKVKLNSTELSNYTLKKQIIENSEVKNIDYITNDNKNIEISVGDVYDFTNIKLHWQEGASTTEETNLPLLFYFYIDDLNWKDYIDYTYEYDSSLKKATKMQLEIKDTAISDKTVHFVYYTVYGELFRQNITFKTNFAHQFADEAPVNEAYDVYADTTYSITSLFKFTHNGVNVSFDASCVKYSIDDGEYIESNSFLFKQVSNNPPHKFDVVLMLEGQNSSAGVYKENYHFSFEVRVLQSVKSNSPNQSSASVSLPNIKYQKDAITFKDIVCTYDTNLSTTGFLFSSIDDQVIKNYKLSASTSNTSFITLSEITKTTDSSGHTIFTIDIGFVKSPEVGKTIIVEFILYNEETSAKLNSYLTFVLEPDFTVSAQYPVANDSPEAVMESEKLYLAKTNYAQEIGNSLAFDTASNKSLSISLKNSSYFNTDRIIFSSGADLTSERIKVRISSTKQSTNSNDGSNVIIAYDEDKTVMKSSLPTYTVDSTGTIHDEIGSVTHFANANSVFKIQWATSLEPTNTLTETIKFAILVDDILRCEYVINLTSKISDIFTVTVNNLYDGEKTYEMATNVNSSANAEIFYVDKTETEAVLSNNTALLTFTPYNTCIDKTIKFYIESNSLIQGEALIATHLISTSDSQSVYLGVEKELRTDVPIADDLSNIFVRIGSDITKYYFVPQSGQESVYSSVIRGQDSISLTHRLAVYYNEKLVDYERVNSEISAGGTLLSSFVVDRADNEKIETDAPIAVELMLASGVIIGNYYYTLKYDFKIERSLDKFGTGKYTSEIEVAAPRTENSLNELYGISGLTSSLNPQFFEEHNIIYSAKVIMVTKTAFITNPITDNILFVDSDDISYLKTPEFYPSISVPEHQHPNNYISLSSSGPNGKVHDYTISVYGAENDGNVAFILLNFGVEGKNLSQLHKILRIKITPNTTSILLYTNSINDPNTEKNPYIINYSNVGSKYLFETKMLGFNNKNNLFNIIIENPLDYPDEKPQVFGEIKDYIDVVFDNSQKTIGVCQKGEAVAYLGDKEGYLKIENAFGYSVNFYIKLTAARGENAMRLPGANSNVPKYLNANHDTTNQFFTGTEMMIVDVDDVETDIGECGGIVVQNLKSSTVNWDYVVNYEIPEINFQSQNTFANKNDNKFTIPMISQNSMPVTLRIVVDVDNGTVVERVVLSLPIEIVQRFVMKQVNSADLYVRDNINFNVTDYILVEDQSEKGESLGDVSMSDKTFTLKIKASHIDEHVTVIATHKSSNTTISSTFTVGYDAKGNKLTAVTTNEMTYYYHILSQYSDFADLKFENYTFTIKGGISAEDFSFVEDKILYLTTIKTSSEQSVKVRINNGKGTYYVVYNLNKNGKQAKSLYEEIISGRILDEDFNTLSVENRNQLLAIVGSVPEIYTFQVSSTPLSITDLQKIKNFSIFNDTIRVKVKSGYGGLLGIKIYLRVYYDDNKYVQTNGVRVANNNAHYEYFSISEILGEHFDINYQHYKIQLIYSLENEDSDAVSMEYDITQSDGSIITTYSTNKSAIYYDDYITYTKEINNLAFSSVVADRLSVLDMDDYNAKVKEETKYYLVKYNDDQVIEQLPITYQVTPKYFILDNSSDLVSNTKFIYANQYSVSQATERIDNQNITYNVYTTSFDVWASAFNLLDGNNNILSTVNNGTDLVFALENEDGVENNAYATLTNNFDLKTTYQYLKNTYHFYIAVYVKLSALDENGDEQLIRVGTIQLELDHSTVFVDNLGIYGIKITHPSNTGSAITTSYEFKKPKVLISDLINNNPELTILGNNIQIGGQMFPISECNIEVITVVDAIYSVEYDTDGYLQIKLDINESLNATGKVVVLNLFKKLPTLDSVFESFGQLTFEIGYNSENNEYYIDLSEINSDYEADKPVALSSKNDSTGVYLIKVKLSAIANNFIGEDYVYTAELISCEDADSGKRVIYPNNKLASDVEITENANDYIFIRVNFMKSGIQNSGILGFKYTTNIRTLGGAYGYAVDISNISEIGGVSIEDVKTFDVSFLKVTKGIEVNANSVFLVTTPNIDHTKYGLAEVTNYIASDGDVLFEINDVGNIMTSSSTFEFYEDESKIYDTFGHRIPKTVNINLNAQKDKIYYYAINASLDKHDNLVALKTSSAGSLYFDLSTVLSSGNLGYAVVRNLNAYISGDITGEGQSYWTGKLTSNEMAYFVIANVLEPISNNETTTIYQFEKNFLYVPDSPTTSTYINVTKASEKYIDLSPLVGSINQGKMYTFEYTNVLNQVSYITAQGSIIHNISMTNLGANSVGCYSFKYLSNIDIDASGFSIPTDSSANVMFKISDANDNLIGVKTITYTYISPSVSKTDVNPLIINETIGAKAAFIDTDKVSFTIPKQSARYLEVIKQSNPTHEFYAIYYEANGSYDYLIPPLSAGDYIEFVFGGEGFRSYVPSNALTIITDTNSLNIVIYDSTNTSVTKQVTMPTDSFKLVVNDLSSTWSGTMVTLIINKQQS